MAGKSFALVGRPTVSLGVLLGGLFALAASTVLTGCPSNISQRVNSGKDYREKGAKKIRPDGENRWRAGKDIVTYPGGDRVDWKFLEIPAESPRGSLTVKVKFDVPRPKLDLAFDVYDAYYERIGRGRESKGDELNEREMRANTKKVTIENVGPGKYYVMVYAPRRTDAASYRISAKFTEKKVAAVGVAGPGEIPDPPKLPAVPDAPEPVIEDPTPKPEPCPNDPSRMQPNCEVIVELKPVKTQIKSYTVSAKGGIVIEIGKGSNAGVAKGWAGTVVDSNGKPVEGGDFTLYSVKARESFAKVRLSVDQVKANRKVILTPPSQ